MKENWKLYIPVLISLILMVSAFFHNQMIDNHNNYRESYLINIEFISLIASFISILVIAGFSLFSLFKKAYGKLLHIILSIILTLIIINIAMSLDSPTLIYIA